MSRYKDLKLTEKEAKSIFQMVTRVQEGEDILLGRNYHDQFKEIFEEAFNKFACDYELVTFLKSDITKCIQNHNVGENLLSKGINRTHLLYPKRLFSISPPTNALILEVINFVETTVLVLNKREILSSLFPESPVESEMSDTTFYKRIEEIRKGRKSLSRNVSKKKWQGKTVRLFKSCT